MGFGGLYVFSKWWWGEKKRSNYRHIVMLAFCYKILWWQSYISQNTCFKKLRKLSKFIAPYWLTPEGVASSWELGLQFPCKLLTFVVFPSFIFEQVLVSPCIFLVQFGHKFSAAKFSNLALDNVTNLAFERLPWKKHLLTCFTCIYFKHQYFTLLSHFKVSHILQVVIMQL